MDLPIASPSNRFLVPQRDRRWPHVFTVVVCLSAVVLTALFLVGWPRLESTTIHYDLIQLRSEVSRLERRELELKLQLELVRNPDRLAEQAQVAHNLVHDLPYTGISVGWQWNPNPTPCKENLIESNHVYDVMNRLCDGGCIYTLGFQPGTVIRGNVFHDAHRSAYAHGGAPNNGIFFDQGSKGYLFEQNVIYITDCIRKMESEGYDVCTPRQEAEDEWSAHVAEVHAQTLMAEGDKVNSWMMGANLETKPPRVLIYFGGANVYYDKLRESVNGGFPELEFERLAS